MNAELHGKHHITLSTHIYLASTSQHCVVPRHGFCCSLRVCRFEVYHTIHKQKPYELLEIHLHSHLTARTFMCSLSWLFIFFSEPDRSCSLELRGKKIWYRIRNCKSQAIKGSTNRKLLWKLPTSTKLNAKCFSYSKFCKPMYRKLWVQKIENPIVRACYAKTKQEIVCCYRTLNYTEYAVNQWGPSPVQFQRSATSEIEGNPRLDFYFFKIFQYKPSMFRGTYQLGSKNKVHPAAGVLIVAWKSPIVWGKPKVLAYQIKLVHFEAHEDHMYIRS